MSLTKTVLGFVIMDACLVLLHTLLFSTNTPTLPTLTLPECSPHQRQTAPFAVVSIFTAEGWHARIFSEYRHYLACAKKLAVSVRTVSPQLDRVLLMVGDSHKTLSIQELQELQHPNMWTTVCRIPGIDSPYGTWIGSGRYDTSKQFSKLHVWRLMSYKAVLYMDLDTLALEPLDPLFDTILPAMKRQHKQVAMVPDGTGASPYNAGVILIRPSLTEYNALIGNMSILHFDSFLVEQSFLNTYYNNESIFTLPPKYNIGSGHKLFDTHYQDDGKFHREVAIIHYIAKPWDVHECRKSRTVRLCAMWNEYPSLRHDRSRPRVSGHAHG
jgi:hypothetical protein